MDGDIDLDCVPLSRLSNESRKLLSSLLNTKKVLKHVCPDHISRYRDWRGLASLVNISMQVEASIKEYPDKLEKLLEIWMQNHSGATIGRLMHYLQLLDRFDVHSDLLDLARDNKLIGSSLWNYQSDWKKFPCINIMLQPLGTEQNGNCAVSTVRPPAPPSCEEVARIDAAEDDLITFQDVQHNAPQVYHAYVLFAPQDRAFVDVMLQRLRNEGLKLCTEDDLLPGFSTRFEPVARLVSERCRRIVLVYSPDFFESPAVKFITHIAQAHGVETNIRNLIPIMYRPCKLPRVLSHYHNLDYGRRGGSLGHADNHDLFWRKLRDTLDQSGVPRLKNGSVSSECSGVVIREMASSANGYSRARSADRRSPDRGKQLALPDIPTVPAIPTITVLDCDTSVSDLCLPDVPSEPLPPYKFKDNKSMLDISQDDKSKKKNRVERFLSQVRSLPSRIGKKKKTIMVEN